MVDKIWVRGILYGHFILTARGLANSVNEHFVLHVPGVAHRWLNCVEEYMFLRFFKSFRIYVAYSFKFLIFIVFVEWFSNTMVLIIISNIIIFSML